jgi:hypothetical protein
MAGELWIKAGLGFSRGNDPSSATAYSASTFGTSKSATYKLRVVNTG